MFNVTKYQINFGFISEQYMYIMLVSSFGDLVPESTAESVELTRLLLWQFFHIVFREPALPSIYLSSHPSILSSSLVLGNLQKKIQR